mmetsp:Transcript_9219/g.56019  ORF Transcript_9219/g.56019 Transcript_9219/m.56019 type:complete len:87 (-) Transcript_9219:941-1201(-)
MPKPKNSIPTPGQNIGPTGRGAGRSGRCTINARMVSGMVEDKTMEDITEEVDRNRRSTEMLNAKFIPTYRRGKKGAPVESTPYVLP